MVGFLIDTHTEHGIMSFMIKTKLFRCFSRFLGNCYNKIERNKCVNFIYWCLLIWNNVFVLPNFLLSDVWIEIFGSWIGLGIWSSECLMFGYVKNSLMRSNLDISEDLAWYFWNNQPVYYFRLDGSKYCVNKSTKNVL